MSESKEGKARRKVAEAILGRKAKGPVKDCSCLWQNGRRIVGNVACRVHR